MTTVTRAPRQRQAIPPSFLRWYRQQFVNRPETYCSYDVVAYTGRRQAAPCTDAVIAAHLAGKACIALDARCAKGMVKWCAISSDAPDGMWQLQALRARLWRFGLVGLLEARPEEPTLWLLFAEPLAAGPVWCMASGLVAWAGRQPQLVIDANDLIVMPDVSASYPAAAEMVAPPFFGDGEGGRAAPFIDGASRPCHGRSTVEALAWLMEQPQLTCEDVVTALHVLHGYEPRDDEAYAAVIAEVQASSQAFQRYLGVRRAR